MTLLAGGAQVQIASPARDFALFPTVPLTLLAINFDIGQNYSITWELSTGERYQGDNITHPLDPDQTEPVTVTMTATNQSDGTTCEPDSRIFYPVDINTFSELPTVSKIHASTTVLRAGQEVELSADISDPVPSSGYDIYWFWLENGRPKRFTGDILRTSFPATGTYQISLVVRDSDNNYSLSNYTTDQIEILVSDAANLPPTAAITTPATTGIQLTQGDSFTFRGQATDPEKDPDLTLNWNYLNVATSQNLTATGAEATFTFTDPGIHQVTLTATDSSGNVSVNQARVFVQTFSEDELATFAPSILTPIVNTRYFVNDPIVLISLSSSSSTAPTTAVWEIRNMITGELVQSLDGLNPGRTSLAEPGLYELFLKGIFGSRTSERALGNVRYIAIQARNGNQPAQLLPTARNSQYVKNGQSITLAIDASDPEGDDIELFWTLNGVLSDQKGREATFTFNLPEAAFDSGISFAQAVSVTAIDSQGTASASPVGYSVFVYQDQLLPEPLINQLPNLSTVFLPLGSPYPLSASLAEPYAGNLNYTWTITPPNILDQITLSEQNPRPYTPFDAGLHYISLQIETEDGSLKRLPSSLIYLYVFDLSKPPQSNITKPNADRIVIETHTSVTLEGQFSDTNIAELSQFIQAESISHQFNWEISGPNGFLETYTQETPLTLDFDQPGTYQVAFHVSNSLGLLDISPDLLTIEVTSARQDSDFEPNDTRDMAAEVDFGNFGGLSVSTEDPVDWYRFCLEEAGSAISFVFDLSAATNPIALQLSRDDSIIENVILQPGGPVNYSFTGSEAGIYYLRFAPSETASSKQTGLDFSIGIEISTPRLIFPYPKSDEVEETELLLLNPTNGQADVTLVARAFDGSELAKASLTLTAGAHWTAKVGDLFASIDRLNLGWVQVLANRSITGLSTTIGRDNATSLAEPAIDSSLGELVVPHIAQATAQWYTRAAIINNSGEQVTTALTATAGNFEVTEVAEVFQSAVIDFEAFFGGSLPSGSEWANIVETNAKTSLVGMELFGTKLGSPRVAGLNLANARIKDPGFTYVRRNLYFPHVAGSDFWTGIAFVNIAGSETDIRLLGYDNQGQVLAEQTMTLAPFEKQVRLAYQFFDGLAVDAGLAWIALETDGFVQGYELFGDNDSDATTLSGFPAVSGGATELVFRKIQAETNQTWTGIAIVNLAANQEANLIYEAMSADGRVLESSVRTVGALRKDVALVQSLFDQGLPAGTAWVRVTSDQPIAGFQLYGDSAGQHMAGVLAQ